jgi:hypothetical protein
VHDLSALQPPPALSPAAVAGMLAAAAAAADRGARPGVLSDSSSPRSVTQGTPPQGAGGKPRRMLKPRRRSPAVG